MSVDLIGRCTDNPAANYKGTTLAMSWWEWRPLAIYCFAVAKDLCESSHHVVRWQSNDGHMTVTEALALGETLQAEIATGRAKAWVRTYQQELENAPDVPCTLCKGTGKRAARMLWAWKPEAVPASGIVECDCCDGYGAHRPTQCNYPLHLDSIQRLADFLLHCGGFEVR
jgi:hypothetical protein